MSKFNSQGAVSGFESGAASGAAAGPIGAVAGGVIGAVAGGLTGGNPKKPFDDPTARRYLIAFEGQLTALHAQTQNKGVVAREKVLMAKIKNDKARLLSFNDPWGGDLSSPPAELSTATTSGGFLSGISYTSLIAIGAILFVAILILRRGR